MLHLPVGPGPKCRNFSSEGKIRTGKQLKKIQVTQNAMLRSLPGIRLADKIYLGKIFEKMKARKARVVARTLKFNYAGHMVRDDKNPTQMQSWVGLHKIE